MGDGMEKVLYSCVSVAVGFSLGIASKPLQEYFELIKEIRRALIEYANCYGGLAKKEKTDKASEKYREFSGRLASVPHMSLYWLYRWLNQVPDKEQLLEAKTRFIGMSNVIYTDDFESIHKTEERIRRCLGLESGE